MTERSHRVAARSAVPWSLAAIAVACAAATVALVVVNRASIQSVDDANTIEVVMPVSFALVGGLVAARRRDNLVGWLFLFMAVVMGLAGVASQYAHFAAITHPGEPGASWALWWFNWSEALVYPAGAATLTLLLLPDGRLPSRRWRPLVVAAVALTVLMVVLSALGPGPMTGPDNLKPRLLNPAGLPLLGGIDQVLVTIVFVSGGAVLLAAAVAPLARMRRAHGDEREQLRWIAYVVLITGVVNALVILGWLVAPTVGPSGDLTLVNLFGFGVGLPVAAGIAIFKYRLYDIDLIISRTLVYGTLAAFITAVYVAIAVGVGSLVGSGGQPNLGLSILATAIVAVGFQPVRERVQRLANRLVYGPRATPYEVLSEFSEHMAESYAADEVLPRMARVLAEGTGAVEAEVWLRSEAVLRRAASWPVGARLAPPSDGQLPVVGQLLPSIPGAERAVAVRHQGELLGALAVRKRQGESLTPIERRLLEDLAEQAGLVLKNVGLTSELLQRLEELRASRQRLVRAQDQERRRLERNLHDGAQQNVVALKVKLGLARAVAQKDPVRAKELVGQLTADADVALETLRDLARGIYPPLLADRGLGAAVEAQAQRAALPVVVESEGVGRYPREVEAAVYFCVLEALQNVQKYAGASRATVRLAEREGQLTFAVEDDGKGFEVGAVPRGSGLTNIADRLDALGGGLVVDSAAGRGTHVIGSLPAVEAATVRAPA